MRFGGADLHAHSTWSDGQDTPRELVRKGVAAGLSALALSDHDGTLGLGEFEEGCREAGLTAVPGVELSAQHRGEDAHLLGLFIDAAEEGLSSSLEVFRRERERRGDAMIERLSDLGFPVDAEAVRRGVEGAFGRPHLARAMVAHRYVESEEEAFDRFLRKGGPAWVPKPKWELTTAISAVHRAGGLAVLAHPVWHADPESVVREAKRAGLDGLEVWHSDHDRETAEKMAELAARYGLLRSAGSDCHGDPDRRPVGWCRLQEEDWRRLLEAARETWAASGRTPVGPGGP